jgi:hypothetical protein
MMKKEKITIKIENKLPRGKMPPPTKKFKDRKKEANKKKCRKSISDKEE